MPTGESSLRRGVWLLGGATALVLLAVLAYLEVGARGWAAAMVERSPSLLYEDARRWERAGQYAAAYARVSAALALAPQRHDCHFLASTCAQRLGDLSASDIHADQAIRHCPPHHPELWRYYYHRGFLENSLGRREQAIRDWAISAYHNPEQPAAFAQLGRAYAARQDFAEARRFMAEALRLAPDNAEYAFLLGTYYMSESDWELALPHLLRAVELDPALTLAYRHLGYCAMQTARLGDAQFYFEKYREERADDPLARNWLRRVRQRLKP